MLAQKGTDVPSRWAQGVCRHGPCAAQRHMPNTGAHPVSNQAWHSLQIPPSLVPANHFNLSGAEQSRSSSCPLVSSTQGHRGLGHLARQTPWSHVGCSGSGIKCHLLVELGTTTLGILFLQQVFAAGLLQARHKARPGDTVLVKMQVLGNLQ